MPCRRAHTLTVLFILTCVLGYVTLLEETPQDTAYNTKRYPGRMRLRPAQMGRGSGGQRPPEAGRLPSPTAPAAWQSQPLCGLCRGHGTAPAWPAAHAALALVGAEDVAQRLWGGSGEGLQSVPLGAASPPPLSTLGATRLSCRSAPF